MQKLMEMEKYNDESDDDLNEEFQDLSGSRRRRRPSAINISSSDFSLPNINKD